MPARPGKLTPQRRRAFLQLVRGGLPVETAARMLGVSESTVYMWRQRSAAHVRGYAGFEADMQQAQAEGEAILVARIAEAGKGNWHATAWLLERLYPERYGPPSTIELPDALPGDVANEDFPGL